jgi:hypothetical protein
MRQIPAMSAIALVVGCHNSELECLDCGPCDTTEIGELDADEVGEVGLSPSQAVASVNGTVLQASFAPDTDALSEDDAFTSSLSFHIILNGVANEEMVLGSVSDPSGPPVECPSGPVLHVPVLVEVELGVEGSAAGSGWVSVMGPERSSIWLNARGSLDGPPDWMQELADQAVCSYADPPAGLSFGAQGAYTLAGSAWDTPYGFIGVSGRGEGGACSRRFYQWSAFNGVE